MDIGPGADAAPARLAARPRAPAPPAQEPSGEAAPRRRTRRTSVDLLSEASGAAALTLSFLGSSKDRPKLETERVGSPPGGYNNSSVFSQACTQHQDVSDAEAPSAFSLQASRHLSQGSALSRKGTITGRSSGGMLSKHLSQSQGSDTLPSPPRELKSQMSSSLQDKDTTLPSPPGELKSRMSSGLQERDTALEHMQPNNRDTALEHMQLTQHMPSQEHIAHRLSQGEEQHPTTQQQEGNDSGSWSGSQEPLVTASGSAATPSDLASSPCYSPLGSRNSGGPLRPTLQNSCGPGSTGDRSSGLTSLTSRLSNSSKPGPWSEPLLGQSSASNPMPSNPQQPNPQHTTTSGDRCANVAARRLSHSGRLCLLPDQATHTQRQGASHCVLPPGLMRMPTQEELPAQPLANISQHQQAQHAQQLQQKQQQQQQQRQQQGLPQVVPAPAARPAPAPSSDALSSSLFGSLPAFSVDQWRSLGGGGLKPSPQKAALGSASPQQGSPQQQQQPPEENVCKQQELRANTDVQLPSIFAAPSYQFSRSSLAIENERAPTQLLPGEAVKPLQSAPERSLTRFSQERVAPLVPPNSSSQGAHVQQRGHQVGQACPSALGQEKLMAERQGFRGRKLSCELRAASRSGRASQESLMQAASRSGRASQESLTQQQQRFEKGGLPESPVRSASPPASPTLQHMQQRLPNQQRPVSPLVNCGKESSLLNGVATLFRVGKKKHSTHSEEPTPEPSIGNIFSGLFSRLRLPTHASSSRVMSREGGSFDCSHWQAM